MKKIEVDEPEIFEAQEQHVQKTEERVQQQGWDSTTDKEYAEHVAEISKRKQRAKEWRRQQSKGGRKGSYKGHHEQWGKGEQGDDVVMDDDKNSWGSEIWKDEPCYEEKGEPKGKGKPPPPPPGPSKGAGKGMSKPPPPPPGPSRGAGRGKGRGGKLMRPVGAPVPIWNRWHTNVDNSWSSWSSKKADSCWYEGY